MSPRLASAANSLVAVTLLVWGIWLLSAARSKSDYIVERVGPDSLACEWTPLHDPRLATLGLSHEEHHSWTDRAVAYIAFRAPAMPEGGRVEFDVVAFVGDHLEVRIDGHESVYRGRGGQVRLEVEPTPEETRRLVVIETSGMHPPSGGDQRWLGGAIGPIRLCAGAGGPVR